MRNDDSRNAGGAAGPSITLYSAPGCPHCAAARAWLAGRGLAFAEVDVLEVGPALHQAVVHAGRPMAPVIEVGREVLVGFDAQRLAELVGGQEAASPGGPVADNSLPATDLLTGSSGHEQS